MTGVQTCALPILNHVAKIDTLHVPYRGAGPAISDLLGAQTQFMVTTIPSVTGLVETGKMRAIAVTSEKRTPLLKDVPSVAESGFPDYRASAWYGFVVPANTPAPIVEKLRDAAVGALESDVVRSRLASDGALPIGNSPDEFRAFMSEEYNRWKDVIGGSNLQLD